jgi:acetyl-CoA carboxylase biotin carboxyl carrier protein
MPRTDDGAGPPAWSEVTARLHEVAAACERAGLGRLRVVEGDLEIEVRRAPAAPQPAAAAPVGLDPAGEPVPADADQAQRPEPAVVRSDVVGIVRMSRPSVSEGAVLDDERELAYVESLGVRNPVLSGGPGLVVAVLVADGQPVDYGQPLFAIER